MKKILIGFLMIVLLSGCSKNNYFVDPPKNIVFQNEQLLWDEVSKATSYQVVIGDDIYDVNKPFFNTDSLSPGVYQVYIIALKGKKYSDPSNKLTFTILRDLEIPKNICFEDQKLKWDAVFLATNYVVKVNGENKFVKRNEFDLAGLPVNTFYDFQVATQYPDGKQSSFSPTIKYHTFVDVIDNWEFTFLKGQEKDLEIDLCPFEGEILKLHNEQDEELLTEDYQVREDSLLISKTFLEKYSYGEFPFFLYTKAGKIIIKLIISDVRKPHLVGTGAYLYQDNTDVIVTFELYGGVISQLSNDTLTENDYEISGSSVTIKHEYLDRMFVDSSRSQLVIGFVLETDVHLVVGLFFVKRGS
ncbi:MAG TPA: X2-like carbohydrate binding domain-containing protein [Bacilli bacterium]|nr:MAG: hypothetical protein BWY97_01123 [Tenericutes bacterium ADurb.BinA124]HPN61010.1 X2-like carbohydrate binding domain-containing protein [Bacilli bacterium]HPX84488.1 X2-like carbohydrate binding domain-containing protein [Bacilli bacterium]